MIQYCVTQIWCEFLPKGQALYSIFHITNDYTFLFTPRKI